jgi:hypothetical protein
MGIELLPTREAYAAVVACSLFRARPPSSIPRGPASLYRLCSLRG